MPIVLDGTTGITGAVNLTTTGNTILGDASNDTLNVGNGGLIKDASGNVGIGTASPASALFVSANTATGGVPEINLENSQNFEVANYLNYKTELIFRGDKQNRYSSAGARLGPLASIATIYSNATLTSDSQQGAGALTFSTRAATATTSSDTLTEHMRLDSSGNLQFNSGYGSVATAYGCRAWVNFNGTGTVAIRASGNISSITDNGTGDYTLNFTTAMSDENYAVSSTNATLNTNLSYYAVGIRNQNPPDTKSTTALRIQCGNSATGGAADSAQMNIVVFR